MVLDRLLSLLQAFADEGVDYVLVDGAAMNVHGILRATEDIDLVVRPDPENVARLRRALRRLWEDPDIDEIRADELAGEYPVVRYGPPGEDFAIDLMARLGTEIGYEDLQAETIIVEGVLARVATPSTLYRMKSATIRPIDQADAAMLKERFEVE